MRDAFQVGRAALAGAAPSMFMPRPAEEADKFLLIPEVPLLVRARVRGRGRVRVGVRVRVRGRVRLTWRWGGRPHCR